MRSTRAIVMILLSLIAGVTAVVLAARWAGQQAAQDATPIMVAAQDLNLGVPLTPAMLQAIPWPNSAMPAGAFQDIAKLQGRVVRTPIFKGEPVLELKLAPEGNKGGLPSLIQDGKRAISVKVNEVVGVAGFALPGSYVDVMVHVADNTNKPVSKIVLQRILVLAVAQEANRDELKPKVVNAVTLEVTPEQAEKIDLARGIGSLSLVLRNPLDGKESETAGVKRDDLLGRAATTPLASPVASAAPAATPAAAPPPRRVTKAVAVVVPRPVTPASSSSSVEVIRGVQKINIEF